MAKRVLEDSDCVRNGLETQTGSSSQKKIRIEKHGPLAPKHRRLEKLDDDDKDKESPEQRRRRKQLKVAKKDLAAVGKLATDYYRQVLDLNGTGVIDTTPTQNEPTKSMDNGYEQDQLTSDPAQEILHLTVTNNKQSVSERPRLWYTENVALKNLDHTLIDKFMADNFISISDPIAASQCFRPITEFSYLPTTESRFQPAFKGFKAPTPIQAVAWPFLFAGRDVIGVAETGSGKTMAFAVPCIRYITSSAERFTGAKAVIISPTRELAMQSFEQVTELARLASLRTVCVYGGVPKDEQRRALKSADIIVATPGRLNDLINEGFAVLDKVGYVVLDEADRMLDKGFEVEIRKIINTTRPMGRRQTLMFTATWPESVRTLAATFMTTPLKIAIGDNPSGDLRANARIVQKVEVVEPRNKEYRLLQLLKQYQSGKQRDDRILVFCLYKKEATRVEAFIRSKGIKVGGIHGDLSQEQRTRSLDAFKKGVTPVLVATDVAARGLDIPAVKLVINCTFPLTVEDYVHRIGRTGRAGKDGLAITLFTEHDKAQSGALINVLKAANQPVPDELLKFGTTVKKKGHEAYGAFFKDVDSSRTATKIKFA